MRKLEQRVQDLNSPNNRLNPPGSPGYAKEEQEIKIEEIRLTAAQQQFFGQLNQRQADKLIAAHAALQRACNDFASYYKYDLIMLTPGLAMPKEVKDSGDFRVVLQEIFHRRILLVSPGTDLTASMIQHLNDRYAKHKANPSSPM